MGMPVVSYTILALFVFVLIELYRYSGTLRNEPEQDNERSASFEAQFARNYIVTHTDFDGIASGALLLRHIGNDSGVLFSSPARLLTVMQNASTGLAAGDSIWIADLALQPHFEFEMHQLLNRLKQRKIDVYWYDHHLWPAGLEARTESLCSHFVLDSTVQTAAELIYSELLTEDEYSSKIMRFLQSASHPDDKDWDRSWRMMLSEVSQRYDLDLMENVLRKWAKNEDFDAMSRSLVRLGQDREEYTNEVAGYTHPRVETNAGRNFIVIDVRSRRIEKDTGGRTYYVMRKTAPSMIVGMLACRKHNADFCIIIWEDFRYSIYRGIDRSMDFNKLFNRFRDQKSQFKIFGHEYAASIRVKPSAIESLRSIFQWRQPPSFNQLIAILQDEL